VWEARVLESVLFERGLSNSGPSKQTEYWLGSTA